MELNVRLWNVGIKWCFELRPAQVWIWRLVTASLSDRLGLLFQAGGDGKGEQGTERSGSSASKSKQGGGESLKGETTVNSLTAGGVSQRVWRLRGSGAKRQSVNTGYREQKWCTASRSNTDFKKRNSEKERSSEKKQSRASRYFNCSSSNKAKLQRRHLTRKGTSTWCWGVRLGGWRGLCK